MTRHLSIRDLAAGVPAGRWPVDLDSAIQCVELAQLAYRSDPEARELALGRFGYRDFRFLTAREDRDCLILVEDDARIVAAVRGTDDYRDWLTNIRIWYGGTPYGRIHRGYYQAALSLLPQLVEQLADRADKPLLLTGHSMGGAVATLLAIILTQQGGRVDGLFTFGQPQVGFRSFRRHFEASCQFPYFRFVHGADAFALWTLGAHGMPGTPCYFDMRGRLSFGQQLSHVPRPDLRFHRLDYYRHFLRLNRMRLNAMIESSDVTEIQPR